ncbi:carboxymuconolactone decarboxylase family protein [Longitalea luteola]|uniref:carboxymuconolactone decarboxylase family protein n=1 Tax=Longitalea luteola TaxID=2812563 RepID=UPI001A96783E|nr:carboxymuconolactone decarboxylase family protein [Longitalea luteola]
MIKSIKHRLDVWKEEPLYWEQIAAMDQRLYGSSIPRSLIELIKIRVSQINKCVFCIDYHTHEALKTGELPRRIFALSAWEGFI